jgi:hypothetical protein
LSEPQMKSALPAKSLRAASMSSGEGGGNA